MRIALLLSFILVVSHASAQTPSTQKPAPAPPPKTATPPQTAPAQPAPAKPAPAQPAQPAATAPRRATTPTTRGGIAITATSPQGATLPGVRVSISGPTERSDQTDNGGQLSIPSLLTGTYRVRFEGEKVTAFEKEVTVQSGRVTQVDVMLNPAPEPKIVVAPAPAAPAPAAPSAGPKGQPLTVGVESVLEKEFIRNQERRESLLACSGNQRTTMIQVNKTVPERLYEDGDAVYYVIGGLGTIQLDGKTKDLALNDFVSVPRGTSHAFTNRSKGGRALVMLAVLSGEPCEQPK
ncbi:MAG TPA: carboxypeptidase regulatory-like domain-containing protein [Vicinamibacterales bacterium]|jgi:mannose-6-phosphate isomerase-like protein (cupin superfamily)